MMGEQGNAAVACHPSRQAVWNSIRAKSPLFDILLEGSGNSQGDQFIPGTPLLPVGLKVDSKSAFDPYNVPVQQLCESGSRPVQRVDTQLASGSPKG